MLRGLLCALCALAGAGAAEPCAPDVPASAVRASTAPVVVVWWAPAAGAAAALLRAALLAAGHERVRLVRNAAAGDACSLLAAARGSLLPAGWERAVLVAPAVPARAACGWAGRGLRALAPAAGLHARLLARPPERAPAACARRLLAADLAALRSCGFPASPDGSLEVLVPLGEWGGAEPALPAGLRARPLPRRRLEERLAAGGAALLVDVWPPPGRWLELPLRVAADSPALLLADEDELRRRAPGLFALLAGSFAPEPAALRAVLAAAGAGDMEQAACSRAVPRAPLRAWSRLAAKTRARHAVAVYCLADAAAPGNVFRAVAVADVPRYVALRRRADDTASATITVREEPVDCSAPGALVQLMLEWRCANRAWLAVGVAAPAEVAGAAAELAAAQRLPLLAYSPGAEGVRASTCSPARLAGALRRVLAACGWWRAALLWDGSPAARAVRAALLARPGLALHEVRADGPGGPAAALAALRAMDARVFVVLGSAWPVLRAAHEAGLAAARGHVWLVTEMDAPADAEPALAELAPLSVSCEWRGGDRRAARAGSLAAALQARLAGAPWPRRLAALADALVTLAEGHARLARHYGSMEHHAEPDKLQRFWEAVESAPVEGVAGPLHYEGGGLRAPRLYLERWGGGGPRRLAAWDGAGAARACPLAAPSPDGRVRCAWRTGPAFEQRCLDAAAGAALAALPIAAAGAVLAWRLLARRDRRLRREAAVRVLAQREAAFAELAQHLVEPAALRLGEELGAGRFGRVRAGELRRARRTVRVAAKAPREGASPAEQGEFLREARLLATLHHPHVVRFEGVCWDGGPPLLLMERALFGDLLHYLRARRHLAGGGEGEAAHVSAPALTRLARAAAAALAYLAARGLVHRDVRAVNCLVDARRELKLADFGLARPVGAADGEYACRRPALLPALWMAPESLARGVAAPASDVWAFGVLALELVTLGARPWGALAPAAAVRAVLAGARPPLPAGAGAETRALLAACWRREPGRRPAARRLAAWLARRPAALRPAPRADPLEPACDSGIGEPEPEPRAALGAA